MNGSDRYTVLFLMLFDFNREITAMGLLIKQK